MSEEMRKKRVAVIGGGLVGALNACYFSRRKYKVDVYEMRSDIRKVEVVRGRSINLALSVRGREALKMVEMEEEVINKGIRMYSRMIHDRDGTLRIIPYGRKDQYIMSVDRRHLNEVLLTAAEKNPDITVHFEHKLVNCDFNTGEIVLKRSDGTIVKDVVDAIIGCDGAFSAVRNQIMKNTLFNYQQEYIPHGYMELNMPPTASDEFAMAINHLHIWARNEYMMIALPNQDKSFTLTLFMPFNIFDSIKTEDDLMNFFHKNFQDSIPLIGEKELKQMFFKSKAFPLISIKCSPYHIGNKALIMGDAAHASVPFYGQGMNCGFEDCLVLNDLLDKHRDDIGAAFEEYTKVRTIDAQAICDLSMYNYIEMRQSVNSCLFLLRKKVDNFLSWLFPRNWIPLYAMVAFTRTRYHECILKRQWQDKVR
ncbi:hypothetical protein CHS0354_032499 [Potamilus streckersoni]|uniref:Kynurenine 3-monooxygenase n=1 Tax=Potamilus streckersoni TaxID=2493646 RepID=A0AAE0SQL9_9BIVA|nr:hypothetical protein CHS0354_032499 [Potamilus streckersoni]